HAIFDHRYFHHNFFVNLDKLLPFADNSLKIRGDYLRTHVSVYNVTDGLIVLHDIVLTRNAFLGHQRRVGGYAIEYSQRLGFLNFLQISGINKKLHRIDQVVGERMPAKLGKAAETKNAADTGRNKKRQIENLTATTTYP